MTFDEYELADALRALPPAPAAWVRAAQELPLLRGLMDEIVARAELDAEFRARAAADLEATLAAEGYEPRPELVAAVRHRLSSEE